MHRSFERSHSRRRRYLDGRWEFETDPGAVDTDDLDAVFSEETDRMTVPGSWNTRPAYYDHFDPAWYRRTVHVPSDTHVRLRFEAVAHDATVYFDGEEVASHAGGYTPFETHLQDVAAGDHELVVRVDNTLDETTIPRPGSDWFPYGGITREVFVEELPDVFVDDLRVEYDLDEGGAAVEATVDVRNLGEATERPVGVEIDGNRDERPVELPPGTTTVTRSVTLDDVERWSLTTPRLYDVVATAGTDDLRDRIGFREVAVDGSEILLNGEPVEIRGVNRHEDHPEWGHAQPARLMELDLDVIEDGGFNAIRGSHYPNHPRFLDFCDEQGLLVIEEVPYWQFDSEQIHHGDVLELGKQMFTEMIGRDVHHPSVFAWSLHNECSTGEEGLYDATEELADHVLDLDDTRPLTYATNNDYMGGTEICDDLVDFVCLNAYWGWYDDSMTWREYLDEMTAAYGDKPIVISEFGGGAVEGEGTFERQKWSETYQAELLVDAIEAIRDDDAVSGFTIWQYCDTRTHPARFDGRPKTKNNKGIVGEYRRPKDAYWAVSDLLSDS